ncbi:vascular endothelial growth factor receptor 1 isoform X2 [Hyla sarda]|uniref:vascular endothelial growth factor receptor 1 isoform X2 n=1 Tax=Hyla sarda TaxID=327740 RepID=UPI0024C34990|nr:vascular endothelial growth factor receptor 1 isoform X2 [Hyla sarda]
MTSLWTNNFLGHSSGSKLKAPVLNIKGKELVVRVGQPIHLTCRGDQTVSWKFPAASRKESKRFHITDNSCQGSPMTVCHRNLTLHNAQISDTGFYSCQYEFFTSPRNPSGIYIFITDENSAFVDMHDKVPQIITITERERLVIPCRVTSPNITVTLRQNFQNVLSHPDDKDVIWDNKKGFIIRKPIHLLPIGLLRCQANVNGVTYISSYYINRQSSAIHKVWLDVPSSIRLLRNATLAINCSVTTNLNSRAEIQWTYPGMQFGRLASIIKRIILSDSEAVVFSKLFIHKVKTIDQGLYTCTAKNGPSTKSINTTVRVHASPYINVKPRKTGVLEAVVGQKSYRLAVKVRAFPPPEITWWKNNLLAADKCARYLIDNDVLTIKDVAEEDAGEYTVSLKLKQWNLIKNVTMTLKVNVKPQIYEKSMSIQEPQPYMLGSRQTLTCTVYGVPPPRITWTWRPCTRNHFGSRCDFHSDSPVPLIIGKNRSMGNKIYSIIERTRLIEGRNKTAGIVVIDDSSVSGIYTCTASNKLGTEKRDIHFHVTDVPSGFHISMDRLAKEGENMTLTCSVNKYLYTNISWILRRRMGNRTINHSISKQRNAVTTEYSTVLTAVIQNATHADSGIYECRATNTFTGDVVSQGKDITIKGEHCNKKVNNSRTSKQRRKKCTTESSVTQ